MFLKKGIRGLVDSANQMQNAESNKNSPSLAEGARGWVKTPSLRDSAISQNLVKNNSVRSTQTRPLRGAKNRIQGCSSATADFLLEADKRGSPPKSKKRQLLARRGSGAGGAALLQKEKNTNENAESKRDFSPMAQNDNFILNLTLFAESTKIPTKYALKG